MQLPVLLSSILLLVLFSPFVWLVRPHRFRHFGWIAAILPALITAMLVGQAGKVSNGHYVEEFYRWTPQLGLELSFRLDGLALLFGLIIAGIGAAVALYTGYYLEANPRQGYFYGMLFLFMASMLGIVWSNNLLLLFVFWEGTSITSYLLIGFNDDDKKARDGARVAFLVTGLGGLAMLLGSVILGTAAGTYTISEIIATSGVVESPMYPIVLILYTIGRIHESAQFPFQFWLPGAMAAPTPASAYLHSATMVKAGIYLLARLHPAFSDSPLWFWSLLVIGAVTMLLGAISALRYFDMKALLAYATISQLGVLIMLLAFRSTEAYIAVAVGILAHALYKGPLFLIAGIVDHATGTRDLRRLGGLLRPMPVVTVTAIFAGLSMAGIPPLFGFVAKETLLETVFHFAEHTEVVVGWVIVVAAAITGTFFVGYSFTLLWEAFLRRQAENSDAAHVHHRPVFSFVLPPLLLTALGTLAPFVIGPVERLVLAPAATTIAGHEIHIHLALWHGWTPVFLTSLIAIAAGIIIFSARNIVRSWFQPVPENFTGAYAFDKIVYWTYDLARWTTRTVQGGTLASQASVVVMSAVVLLGIVLLQFEWSKDLSIDWSNWPHISEVLFASLAVIAAIVTVRARTRLSAIVSIGVVGITVTIYFTFFDAPDLALTQLLVDILTVVLLVLVFYRIPPQRLPRLSTPVLVRNLVVSIAVGVFGFFLVLVTVGTPYAPSISEYFLLNSVPLAHGANIVNVILVDFRGFDTMGEITVLGIAAVGGYALLRSALLRPRPSGVADSEADQQPERD